MFLFAELITKAAKIKKRKRFLTLNDFEDKNERNPCFNSYSEKREENVFPAQKLLFSPDHIMEAILLFIIVTSTQCNTKPKY